MRAHAAIRSAAAAAFLLGAAPGALGQDLPGLSVAERTLVYADGRPTRAYLVVEPTDPPPGPRAPTVVLLHGGGQSMRIVLDETSATNRWLTIAAQAGIRVIAPNGYNEVDESGLGDNQTWNDLRPDDGTAISRQDDAGFIADALAVETERLGLDARAFFVTGSSNGGMMSFRMLVERPDLFAAGAAFIAGMPEAEVAFPADPRPVMVMNGDADGAMPWDGGPVGRGAAPVRSGPETRGFWLDAHGVSEDDGVTVPLPNREPLDLTEIERSEYRAPGDGAPAPVVFYRVRDGGHAIPALPGDPVSPVPGRSLDTRGVDRAWDFFRAHAPCPGDIDGDRSALLSDFGLLAANFGSLVEPFTGGDLNGDGRVLLADFAAFVADFGCERR